MNKSHKRNDDESYSPKQNAKFHFSLKGIIIFILFIAICFISMEFFQ